MPRVTVLLTCYNHLRFLPAALDGVLEQTFKDFEILALDDGSTDGSREWLLERETEGKLRTIFNAKNLGTYATLNVGLREATGEFIAILNDDDLWAPDKLRHQVQMLDSKAAIGLVHTGGWFIDADGEWMEDPAPLGFTYPKTHTGDILALEILFNHIITSSVLVRKSCFDERGNFDERFFGSGDWHMWLRIAQKYEVGYIDEPLTFYRIHGSNASHQKDRINADDARIREWITSWAHTFKSRASKDADLHAAFAHNWACLGTERTWAGDPKGGRFAYRQAIKMNPKRWRTYVRWLATFLPRENFKRLS